ncbi:MAG: family 78 glycoside hydrolase catalytic domain, partial [Kiritimatiellae bacterium]|nr:family 78 glycoside hydrolase catalytic domain [Kiritimatiellia bacterium]
MHKFIKLATLSVSFAAATAAGASDMAPSSWAWLGFVREGGAVVSPRPESRFDCPMRGKSVAWEARDTFNPAAATFGGELAILYRAEDASGEGIGERTSRIGLALSSDGLSFRRLGKPVLFPGKDGAEEWDAPGGCEDPRICETPDGRYLMLYTMWNRKVPRLGVATSCDLLKWTKHGPAFSGRFRDLATKSASVVCERKGDSLVAAKIGGRYLMYWGEEFVNLATSDDLVNWNPVCDEKGELLRVIEPRKGKFDSALTECGPPAVLTRKGILLLYNGKNKSGEDGDTRYAAGAYCGGQVLFSLDDPTMVVSRLDEPFFIPEAEYEKSGQYPSGTVFLEGLVPFRGKWRLFFGCADSRVGMAILPDDGMENRAVGVSSFADPKSVPSGKFTFVSPAGEWKGNDLKKDEKAAAFSRCVVNAADIARVEIFASALGTFELYVNGSLVSVEEDGNRADFLRPGATDVWRKRHFLSYDVTRLWRRGKGENNDVSAFVARSWFSDSCGGRKDVKPAFAAKVKLVFSDVSSKVVETDESWNASFTTPFDRAGIYYGEVRDARVTEDAVTCAGKNPAEANTNFTGEVAAMEGPGVSLRRDLALDPKEAYVYSDADVSGATTNAFGKVSKRKVSFRVGESVFLKDGERLVVDFGQNAASIPEIIARAEKGVVLSFRGGEMLNDANGEKSRGNDGPCGSVYRANLRKLAADGAMAKYVFAGGDTERYKPAFTFFGYRYAEISATGPVEIYSVRSIPVTSVAKSMERGTITTGNEEVNRLIKNARWGMYSNYLSIPTDCPQRDERMGWCGDTQVFVPAAFRFADAYGFISKWMTDMRDAQLTGEDGLYPAVAPMMSWGAVMWGRLGWSDAGVAVPWTAWLMTGDTWIVKDNWASMSRYVDRIARTQHRTTDGFQWGDWVSYEQITPTGSWPADHQWDGRYLLPEAQKYFDYLGGCQWLMDARRMADMAKATGRDDDAKRYSRMADDAREYLKTNFFEQDGGLLKIFCHMQTPALFALRLGLYDGAAKDAAVAALLKNIEDHCGCLQTGFLGTALILDALAYDAGRPDAAYSLLLQDKDPSWLFTVRQGATTMWERWNSYTKEKGFGPVDMNSFNHYAYGSFADWLFGAAAGIRPSPAGGFDDRFELAPLPDRRLGSVEATYKTKNGVIRSAWRYHDDGTLVWEFTVPKNSVASVSFNGTTRDYPAGTYTLETVPRPLRPPAVPLVTCDPFFSVWSPHNRLTDGETTHWASWKTQPLNVVLEADGKVHRLCGTEPADAPALEQVACEVRPLTTVVRHVGADGLCATLEFLTAKDPDDLEAFSRPVTYLTASIEGAKTWKLRVSFGPNICREDESAAVATNVLTVAGRPAVRLGRIEQNPLGSSGDTVRCDWGYAWTVDCGDHFILAYDDVKSIRWFDRDLPAYWRRDGKSFEKMLEDAVGAYAAVRERAQAKDAALLAAFRLRGGEKYARLCALAWRQSFAACKLVTGPDGELFYFSKENGSNGCIGTVDVFYPQLPLLLYTSTELTRATLRPILEYASSDKWNYDYAPHDLGQYPLATGQVYSMGTDPKTGKPHADADRMPVEECGNMLIALAALAQKEGNAGFAEKWWPTVAKWAEYLKRFGFDPGDQLCTDDFAGHLAHNANLSLKSILALRSYAMLVEMRERARGASSDESDRLKLDSLIMSMQWVKAAKGGRDGATRLAFDQPGTWSLKYNLVWDRVLGFGLFPDEVFRGETAAYVRFANKFGVPLDSRKTYTKGDWTMWCAAMADNREEFDSLVSGVYRFADETPSRVPLSDWYETVGEGKMVGFLARSVVGGFLMPMLTAA